MLERSKTAANSPEAPELMRGTLSARSENARSLTLGLD